MFPGVDKCDGKPFRIHIEGRLIKTLTNEEQDLVRIKISSASILKSG